MRSTETHQYVWPPAVALEPTTWPASLMPIASLELPPSVPRSTIPPPTVPSKKRVHLVAGGGGGADHLARLVDAGGHGVAAPRRLSIDT